MQEERWRPREVRDEAMNNHGHKLGSANDWYGLCNTQIIIFFTHRGFGYIGIGVDGFARFGQLSSATAGRLQQRWRHRRWPSRGRDQRSDKLILRPHRPTSRSPTLQTPTGRSRPAAYSRLATLSDCSSLFIYLFFFILLNFNYSPNCVPKWVVYITINHLNL